MAAWDTVDCRFTSHSIKHCWNAATSGGARAVGNQLWYTLHCGMVHSGLGVVRSGRCWYLFGAVHAVLARGHDGGLVRGW